MRRSTFISSAIHVAILLWAVAVFPSARPEQTIQDIAVDIVSPSELTKLKAGMAHAKDEAPLARQEEPKPKPVLAPPKPEEVKPAVPPPPPPPQAKPEEQPKPKEAEKPKEPEPKKELPKEAEAKPKPEPAKEPEKKPEPKPEPKTAESKPEPKKQAEKKPKTESKPKPKPSLRAVTKRDFNADRIAALLNKMPDAGAEPRTEEPVPEEPRKPVRGQSNGRELTMSVNEIDALRARIAQCWNPPPGGLGADAIIVKLRLRLNEDGSLVGYPTIANSGSSPFFQAAADSAVRAVFQCQPYSLPSEKYAVWRDMILNFDPRQMYGSG